MIDAHHHLWDLSAVSYPWLEDKSKKRFFGDPTPIQKNYLIQDFKKAAADLGADFESSDIKEMQKLIIEIDEYIKFANAIDKVPQI